MVSASLESTPADRWSRLIARAGGWFFWVLAAYFLLHGLLRVLVSDTVELDEAEQVVFFQAPWRLGYGSQPPLYMWLQSAAFAALGVNVAALAMVKAVLLFALYAFTRLAAREVCADDTRASVAAFGLLFVPQIAWEAQRDLTHSVLATTLAAATLWCGLRLVKAPTARSFAWFGLAAGLGILSKYTYALFFGPFAIAMLLGSRSRKALLRPGLLVSLAVFLAVTGPHWGWALTHADTVLRKAHRLQQSAAEGVLIGGVRGLAVWAKSVAMSFTPIGVLFWFASRRLPATGAAAASDVELRRLLLRTLVLAMVIPGVLAVISGVNSRERWMLTVQFLGPLCGILLLEKLWQPLMAKRLLTMAGAVAAAIVLALPAIPLFAGWTNRPTRLNANYDLVAAEFRRRGVEPGVIAFGTKWVGGNLKRHFPNAVAVGWEFQEIPMPRNVPWLVVWDPTRSEGIPPAIVAMVTARRGVDPSRLEEREVAVPYRHCPSRLLRLKYIVMEPGTDSPRRD